MGEGGAKRANNKENELAGLRECERSLEGPGNARTETTVEKSFHSWLPGKAGDNYSAGRVGLLFKNWGFFANAEAWPAQSMKENDKAGLRWEKTGTRRRRSKQEGSVFRRRVQIV